MEKRFIKNLCYELYKADWLRRISYEQTMDELKNYYEDLIDDESVYSFNDYLEDFGYNGKLYATKDEFLDNEFQETLYMKSLLGNDELYEMYLKEIKNK